MAGFAPGVAFEILSPSNTPSCLQRKRKDYTDRPSSYFQEGQTLVIETLPYFSLDLNRLFST
jgi:hypothetical protein